MIPAVHRAVFRSLHLWVFGAYACLAFAVYHAIFVILPLQGDNFYTLAVVHYTPFTDLLRGDPAFYPEWRPLSFATIWIEHRLFDLDGLQMHFFDNLLLWTASAWLVYRIVFAITGRGLPAFIAGLFLLLDRRCAEALTWISERQTLLANVCGLAAMGLLVRAKHRPSMRECVWLTMLLLAAGLSKEYGLAFAGAVLIDGLWRRHWHTSGAAMAALSIYAALRIAGAHGALGAYCEDMGYLFTTSEHCVNPATLTLQPQMLYNVVASTTAMFMSGLFSYEGQVQIVAYRVLIGVVFCALALIAVARKEPALRIAAVLPLAVGALSFMLFRPRNQLIGIAGVAILAGAGLSLLPFMRATQRHSGFARVALLLISLLLAAKAIDARHEVLAKIFVANDGEPCRSSLRRRVIGRQFAPVVKLTFGMDDPYCLGRYD
jgi:hypothetical protein